MHICGYVQAQVLDWGRTYRYSQHPLGCTSHLEDLESGSSDVSLGLKALHSAHLYVHMYVHSQRVG